MIAIKRSKKLNIAKVLRTIWLNPGISRIAISRDLELDKSTVTLIVNELIEVGLVCPVAEGKAGPQGGRRPIQLIINKDFACVIGVEFQPQACSLIAADLNGEIFTDRVVPVDFKGRALDEVFLPLVKAFVTNIKKGKHRILALGFGAAGIIDPFQGIINQSIPMNITTPYFFSQRIGDRFDYISQIENDANCCAWGELVAHRNSDLKDFLFVLMEIRKSHPTDTSPSSIAVGMGVVIDGKVHRGATFSAGEFRSILWKKKSPTQFSTSSTATDGIEADAKLRKKIFRELGRHVAFFVNTLNLSHVVLGGDVEPYREELVELLDKEIQTNWPYPNRVDCQIKFSSAAHLSVAFGAAGMMLGQLFAEKEIEGHRGDRLPLGIDLMTTAL